LDGQPSFAGFRDTDGEAIDPGEQINIVEGIAQVKASIASERLDHASAIELVPGLTLDDAVNPFTFGSFLLERRISQAAKFIQQQLIELLKATKQNLAVNGSVLQGLLGQGAEAVTMLVPR
jgi:hypothetical protein